MRVTKSLSFRERWRRSRRRGQIATKYALSPAIAGALPKGEPLDTRNLRGMGFARSLCITKAKLVIKVRKNVYYKEKENTEIFRAEDRR